MSEQIQRVCVDGTWFHPDTSYQVRSLLNTLIKSKTKVQVWLGDTATGRAWLEEHDIIGRIGRSTGNIKIPLLVPSKEDEEGADGFGGPGLSDDCVVRIESVSHRGSKARLLYSHPKFYQPKLEMRAIKPEEVIKDFPQYRIMVTADGEEIARFRDLNTAEEQAEQFLQRLRPKVKKGGNG